MNTDKMKQIIVRALQSSYMVQIVKKLENGIIVYFKDGTNCTMDLKNKCELNNFESDNEKGMVDYYLTHNRNEFIDAVRSMENESPGTYSMIIILVKLQELDIITPELSMSMAEKLTGREKELDNIFRALFKKYT